MGKLTSLWEVIMSKSLKGTFFVVLAFAAAPISVNAHPTDCMIVGIFEFTFS